MEPKGQYNNKFEQSIKCALMPPKSRARSSRQHAPELAPIYQILADKEAQDPLREVVRKLQALARHDSTAADRSFVVFLLRVCGLDGLVEKLDAAQPIQSIQDLLQEMCEEQNKTVVVNELFLINPKSKFHKEFIGRVTELLEVFISDESDVNSGVNLARLAFQFLEVVSKCKMRNVRSCAVTLAGMVIHRMQAYFGDLSAKKNKKAPKLLKQIDESYLEAIVKPRTKDIDPLIREKSYEIVNSTLLGLEELLSLNKLNQFYLQPVAENKHKITEICIKSISRLFRADKQKLGLQANKTLEKFGAEAIKVLEELVLIPNQNSCLAMEALHHINTFNPELNAMKPRVIAKIFEIHGYEKYQQGLKKAVFMFFKSLIPFNSKQELNQHKPLLLVEITNLLCSINSTKLLETILQEFFNSFPELFTFDEMFLLLLTEYYHKDGSDIELHTDQLRVICSMICEFNTHLRTGPKTEARQNEEACYNKNVLNNCKELFYDKMAKHTSLAQLYLRLFSQLYLPLTDDLSNYLTFVFEKVLDLVREEQYVTMAGDNLVHTQQIIQECVNACNFTREGHFRIEGLFRSFGLAALQSKDSFNQVDIIKINSLVSVFEVQSLMDKATVRRMLETYTRSQEKVLKLELLSYVYNTHKWLFSSLFNSPTIPKHQEYIEIRTMIVDFLVEGILNQSEDSVVKLACFNVVCRVLSLVSNSKISDVGAVYYDPSNACLESLFGFVDEHVHFEEDETMGEVTVLIANLGIENLQAREQILANMLMLFTQCTRLATHRLSVRFIVNLLLVNNTVSKASAKMVDSFLMELVRAEAAEENGNKFVFWRLFNEIMHQLSGQDEERVDKILLKVVELYFKKAHPKARPVLGNKLMLYVADSLDKTINTGQFTNLAITTKLLNRTYRRFAKQTLQRLGIFFNAKVAAIEDPHVKEMKKFLAKIGRSTGKKTKSRADSDGEDSSSEDEAKSDAEDEKTLITDQEGNEEDIMVETTPVPDRRKSARVRTKAKA